MKAGRYNIIIGGQAGSEAKGKLSGWLCDKHKPDLLVMTASPNAGHTVVLNGKKMVSYHLPIGAVMCDCPIILGPASLINIDIFKKEIEDLGIDPARITVDSRASIITQDHINREKAVGLSNIGSTLQGIGACRKGKMDRDGEQQFAGSFILPVLTQNNTSSFTNQVLDNGGKVLCETTQGFDLDLEHGISPTHCTSKMINPAMAMAEAGVSPALIGNIYGVIRPYPIRVNNRTGFSGDYAEVNEINWDTIADRSGSPSGSLNEITTTTKLPRRVFGFSWLRFTRFIQICRPTYLCLQFANYLDYDILGVNDWWGWEGGKFPAVTDFLQLLSKHVDVRFIGTGPEHEDMIELNHNI